MATPVLKSTTRPPAADPYATLVAPIAQERTRAKTRAAIERVVRLASEFAALDARHDVLMAEVDAVDAALRSHPNNSLERLSYERRWDQLEEECRPLERQLARLEQLLGWM